METRTDYQSIVEEIKERNRLFLAINQIKLVALNFCSDDVPEEFRSQFELILQKCDDGLGLSK